MELAITIILVMYFFLLPARYAGVRYAPTVIERQIVLAIIGIAIAVGYTFTVGYSITPKPIDFAFFFLLGAITIYVLTFPFRLLLGFKVPVFERLGVCAILIVSLTIVLTQLQR